MRDESDEDAKVTAEIVLEQCRRAEAFAVAVCGNGDTSPLPSDIYGALCALVGALRALGSADASGLLVRAREREREMKTAAWCEPSASNNEDAAEQARWVKHLEHIRAELDKGVPE